MAIARLYAVQTDNALKVHFAAKVGDKAEEEFSLAQRSRRSYPERGRPSDMDYADFVLRDSPKVAPGMRLRHHEGGKGSTPPVRGRSEDRHERPEAFK